MCKFLVWAGNPVIKHKYPVHLAISMKVNAKVIGSNRPDQLYVTGFLQLCPLGIPWQRWPLQLSSLH